MKRKLYLLLGCLIGSVSVVLVLDASSYRWNRSDNGFVRLLPPHLARPEKIMDIGFNSYYVAGAAGGRIYLANSVAPTRLLVTDEHLSDSQHLMLGVQGLPAIGKAPYQVALDSNSIYLLQGMQSGVLRGPLADLKMGPMRKSIPFFTGVPLSPSSLVVRTYDRRLAQYFLEKALLDGPVTGGPSYLLDKQDEGVFSTDGMLVHAPYSKYIFYVYFHCNKLICLDTNLNLLYKGRTIDTISHVQIRLGQIASEGVTTLASPAYVVNRQAWADGDRIFVNSRLRANNEIQSMFDQYSVIDVYGAGDGKYQFSFYLPDHKGEKISSFGVFGKTLVAIYDHYLYLFRLDLPGIG